MEVSFSSKLKRAYNWKTLAGKPGELSKLCRRQTRWLPGCVLSIIECPSLSCRAPVTCLSQPSNQSSASCLQKHTHSPALQGCWFLFLVAIG
ncbi:hypothetical protein ILYODFUR_016473 [Ilyodon furcidens]|uniref:Uncharacterized protein n=1 Tax=Ilyodon furcidens TaxID=33524 RepID=A0ABV0U5U8_9TELE